MFQKHTLPWSDFISRSIIPITKENLSNVWHCIYTIPILGKLGRESRVLSLV